MITIFYKNAWIHENFTNGTVLVQLPIKGSMLYLTKEVKSVLSAKRFITKNQEYINKQ